MSGWKNGVYQHHRGGRYRALYTVQARDPGGDRDPVTLWEDARESTNAYGDKPVWVWMDRDTGEIFVWGAHRPNAGETVVVYVSLSTGRICVRDADEFFGLVDSGAAKVLRFALEM